MSFAISLHLLASVLWVGGMFFAYVIFRPTAALLLEPPLRLQLWSQIFKVFFPWVWLSIITLLTTGLWVIITQMGGMSGVGIHVHIMLTLGLIMMLLFLHLFFSPYKKLQRAVIANEWEVAGMALNQIRKIIAINLSLGLSVMVIASAGRFF